MSSDYRQMLFKKLSLTTLVAVYFLILVGGIVRSTGSGMGCPDWPKCFGKWVPPTDVSELPANYKEAYSQYRNNKNIRFASLLSSIGMKTTAESILTDDSILMESDFNVYKTWTEYFNRIIGATIGLLILATMIFSFVYKGVDNSIVGLSVTTFVLVLIQGWIGSVVVSTNLLPWTVTLHMALALIIVSLLIIIVFRAWKTKLKTQSPKKNKWILFVISLCLITMVIQILLGTRVRESLDMIAAGLDYGLRETWIEGAGLNFLVHRSFSLIVLLLHAFLLYRLIKIPSNGRLLRRSVKYLFILVVLEILSGVVMAYFGIPPFIQPVHLLLSTLIFGLLIFLYLSAKTTDKQYVVE